MVLSALLGQGPAYIAFVGWALAQQLSIPRQFRKTLKFSLSEPKGQSFMGTKQIKRLTLLPAMYHHMIRNSCIGFMLIVAALCIGMFGYHFTERMSWIDSFLNASMILSGMGPAATLTTTAGKLFAGFYALFSGLAFIAIVVIMLSPVIHMFFRKIHMESNNDEKDS